MSVTEDDDLDLKSFDLEGGLREDLDVAPMEVTLHDRLYRYAERSNLWLKTRWSIFSIVLLAFLLRVIIHHGFYIIAYAYGIYFLNLTLGFLSPLEDPELACQDDEEESERDDFRPFVRRLPEFKYWFYSTQYLCISGLFTCFEAFNLPVFWPILVAYFCLLLFMTMKDRINHMITYGYVPWSGAKKQYGNIKGRTASSDNGQPS